MAPLQKPGNGRRAPLALNPQKSKDVLAVLAERNQAVVAVGAWVEPASPASWEVSAHVSLGRPRCVRFPPCCQPAPSASVHSCLL